MGERSKCETCKELNAEVSGSVEITRVRIGCGSYLFNCIILYCPSCGRKIKGKKLEV